MKPPIGSFPDPTTAQEAVTRAYADANYGSVVLAQGDYVHSYLAVNMSTSLVLPQRVLFDTVASERGDLGLDITTNVGRFATLKAGRTYMLQGSLRSSSSIHTFNYNWHNVTADVGIGSSAWAAAVNSASTTNSQPMATAIITPTVDTEVELRIVAANNLADDIDAFYTYATIVEIGARIQNGISPSALEYMDTIEVGADTQSISFGASGDGVTQRALNGDADETYILEWSLPLASAVTKTEIRPNGVSTNLRSVESGDGTGVVATATGSTWQIAVMGTSDLFHNGVARLAAKSGKNRSYIADSFRYDDNTAYYSYHNVGGWEDDSTVITSLEIRSDIAAGIKAGAEFKLFRLKAQPTVVTAMEANLWYPPTVAHAIDDEFDSTILNPAWTVDPAQSGSPIDPYASFASGGPRIEIHTDRRASWLTIQPDRTGLSQIHKPHTVPTNGVWWIRCNLAKQHPVAANGSVSLTIGATATGEIDNDNRVLVNIFSASANTFQARLLTVEGGVVQANIVTDNSGSQGEAFSILAIQKVGSTFHAWAMSDSGNKVFIGSRVYTGVAVDRVSLGAYLTTVTSPGNVLAAIDFLRFKESATFLP